MWRRREACGGVEGRGRAWRSVEGCEEAWKGVGKHYYATCLGVTKMKLLVMFFSFFPSFLVATVCPFPSTLPCPISSFPPFPLISVEGKGEKGGKRVTGGLQTTLGQHKGNTTWTHVFILFATTLLSLSTSLYLSLSASLSLSLYLSLSLSLSLSTSLS